MQQEIRITSKKLQEYFSTLYKTDVEINCVGELGKKTKESMEKELKGLLKVVFWVAVIVPLILFPLYYLLVSLGM